jgi:hypothetical protein
MVVTSILLVVFRGASPARFVTKVQWAALALGAVGLLDAGRVPVQQAAAQGRVQIQSQPNLPQRNRKTGGEFGRSEEPVLRTVRLKTTDQALLDFFRKRTQPPPRRSVIGQLARSLANEDDAEADDAQGELVRPGAPVLLASWAGAGEFREYDGDGKLVNQRAFRVPRTVFGWPIVTLWS